MRVGRDALVGAMLTRCVGVRQIAMANSAGIYCFMGLARAGVRLREGGTSVAGTSSSISVFVLLMAR